MKYQYIITNVTTFRTLEPIYYLSKGNIVRVGNHPINEYYIKYKNLSISNSRKNLLNLIAYPSLKNQSINNLKPYVYIPYFVMDKTIPNFFVNYATKNAEKIFVSGTYMEEHVKKYNPNKDVYNVGFSKIDLYPMENKYKNVKVNKNKQTILYLPTWGWLSNENKVKELSPLKKEFNLLVKTHMLGKRSIGFFSDVFYGIVKHADIIITDVSNSFFEAIPHNKPMILVNNGREFKWLKEIKDDICTVKTLKDAVNCIIEKTIFVPKVKNFEKRFLYKLDFGASKRILKILGE